MLKKIKLKEFMSGIVFTLILVSCINVFASGAIREKIDVLYNDIKLVVDGKLVKFGKDSAGKQIEPFIYNGTTYLPVRAVGEAIGKKVDWDGTTQTVYLGEKPGEINYMTEIIEPYSKYNYFTCRLNEPDKLSMGGKEYKTGYFMDYDHGAYAYFNLDGQYTEIEAMVGALGNNDTELNVYLDGKLYESIEFKGNELPKKITIPVSGVMQLRFEIPSYRLGIGDPILK